MTLLIWDLDGTLIDSFATIRSAAEIAYRENGLTPISDAELGGVVGLGLDNAFEQLLADTGPDPELVAAVVASYRVAWRRPDAVPMTLFDGVAPMLAELADGSVPMAVATGKGRRGATEALAALDIADYFDPVMTVDDVVRGKPHPDMALAACAARSVPPASAVMIGDTSFDIEMGRRAGTATVAVTWGNHPLSQLVAAGPDHVVHDVAELRSVVGGLNGPTAALHDQ